MPKKLSSSSRTFLQGIYITLSVIGASLSEPHIDHDNVPRRGECLYLCIWLRVMFVRLNVPENTPIQSITRSARAH